MPQLLLAHSANRVDLVTQDEEGHLRQLLNGKKGVQLRLGLVETLGVGTVDQEHDAIHFWEIISP